MDLEKLKDVRVLLVDDDEEDFIIIKKTFQQIEDSPFLLDWVSSFEEAKQLIMADKHDVYLIDYRLGEHNGLELLKFAMPEKRTQPFILLTGVGNETVEWKSLELAASDYLVKGAFNAQLLSRTLYYALQRKYIEAQRVEYLLDLNRSKDEFISIASHQLRTPATAVKQYVGMLLEGFAGELDTQQRKLLQRAYESNERQLKIVTDLLKVAQVDAGKIMLRKSKASIATIIEEVGSDLASTFESRGQTFKFASPREAIVLEVDAASMRMVLENIVDNASKYSEENTLVEVVLKADVDTVCIHVKDEGVGIDPKTASKLFEKFSRLDNSLSTKVGGTGLGLYWAKKIVDLHGGEIVFEPNRHHGTTFTVKLPINGKV
jgi:signal transduction histidine kinase